VAKKRARERPERLAEKLLQIRKTLGLSQSEMLHRIGKGESGHRNFISNYENGVRLPSLLELLAYARAASVSVEILIDDDLDLPKRFGS
jgi:transcriptional regulator with XRE-family HTH domain